MNCLELNHILDLHREIIQKTGGSDGVLSLDVLEGAVGSVWATFAGTDLYPTVYDKAAILCYNLITGHAFVDGNKRIGVMAMCVFLKINDVLVNCNDKELEALGFGVAEHKFDKPDILCWIKDHSCVIEQFAEQGTPLCDLDDVI